MSALVAIAPIAFAALLGFLAWPAVEYLIHGILSSHLQWAPNRARLAESFRLVMADLWGHGRSPAPTDADRYSVEALVAELEALRRAEGRERWIVCGQSFGAGLAIRYALAHPDRVRGLVLTNSRSAFSDLARQARPTMSREDWAKADLRAMPYHPRHARRFPEALKVDMEAAADGVASDAMWGLTGVTLGGLCCLDDLGAIAVPTLLVNGRFEKAFQPDRDRAAETVPGIEVVDLDGGHSVNVEAPDGFDRAVLDFAARLPEA